MLPDRYGTMNLFALVPKLSLETGPELAQLDRLLDDIPFQQVKAYLAFLKLERYRVTP